MGRQYYYQYEDPDTGWVETVIIGCLYGTGEFGFRCIPDAGIPDSPLCDWVKFLLAHDGRIFDDDKKQISLKKFVSLVKSGKS